MSTERRDVVLAADCGGLRRRLGPTAWVVFEELLAVSTGSGERCRACVSVRGLGRVLGLNKDTVARALTRLAAAGLVDAVQTRSASGVFATGSYRLTVPASIAVCTPPRPSTVERATPSSTGAQLTLALET
jgi:DNA-binding IclR family transcriptional regulator